jgi:hypothetical protein
MDLSDRWIPGLYRRGTPVRDASARKQSVKDSTPSWLISQCRPLLRPLAGVVGPLWESVGAGEVPQTLPVLVRHCPRDRL